MKACAPIAIRYSSPLKSTPISRAKPRRVDEVWEEAGAGVIEHKPEIGVRAKGIARGAATKILAPRTRSTPRKEVAQYLALTRAVSPLYLRFGRKSLSWRALRAWREIQMPYLGLLVLIAPPAMRAACVTGTHRRPTLETGEFFRGRIDDLR